MRASYFSSFEPGLNESESIEAFEELCEAQGLDFKVCASGNYHELAGICGKWRADAVFFLDGIPACRFLRSYAPALSRIPVIASGPCVAHPEIPEYARIIAYEPDFEEMGRASVRQLLEYKTPLQAVRNVRVRGLMREPKQIE